MRWTTGWYVSAGLDGRQTVNKNLAIIVISAVVIAALVVVLVGWPSNRAHSGGLALRGKDGQPGAIDLSREELHEAILLQKTPFYRNIQTGEAAPFEPGSPKVTLEMMELVTDELNPKAWAMLDQAQGRLTTALADHPDAPEADRAHAQRLLAQIALAKGDYRADEGDLAFSKVHTTLLECDGLVELLGETYGAITDESNVVEAENPVLNAQIAESTEEVATALAALNTLKAEDTQLTATIAALKSKIAELREAEAVLRGKSNDDSIRATEAMEFLEEALVIADQVHIEQDKLAAFEYDQTILKQTIAQAQVAYDGASHRLDAAQGLADGQAAVVREISPDIAARRQEWDTHHAELMAAMDTLESHVDASLAGWRAGFDHQTDTIDTLARAGGGNDGKIPLLELKVRAQAAQVRTVLGERTLRSRLALLRMKMDQAEIASSDPAVAKVESIAAKLASMEELTDQAVALSLAMENDYDDILDRATDATEAIQQAGQAEIYVHLYDLTGEEDYRTRAESLINEVRLEADDAEDPILRGMVDDLQSMLNMPSSGTGMPEISFDNMSDEEQIRQVFDLLANAAANEDFATFEAYMCVSEGDAGVAVEQAAFGLVVTVMAFEDALDAKFGAGAFDEFAEMATAASGGMDFPTADALFPSSDLITSVEVRDYSAEVFASSSETPFHVNRIDGRWLVGMEEGLIPADQVPMFTGFIQMFTAMVEIGMAEIETAETLDDVLEAMMAAMGGGPE